MIALPEWITKLQNKDSEATLMEEVPSGALAYEALAIAWEALENVAEDKTEFMKNRTGCALHASDAMRRITELGKGII